MGIVSKLLNPDHKKELVNSTKEEYESIRDTFYQNQHKIKLLSINEARDRKPKLDYNPVQPQKPGVQQIQSISLNELKNYIDWSPFFHAWEFKGTYPEILNDPEKGVEARKLFNDAQNMLASLIEKKSLTAKAVFGIFPAQSKNENILLPKNDTTFSFPRQLIDKGNRPNFCLADFISPNGDDHIGMFTVTAGHGLEKLVEQFESDHDDYNAIMVKILADRFAEATTEWLHKKIREDNWGYGSDEIYSNEELIKEKYQGIRPAPGYPSCPDHSEKDKIWKLLDVKNAISVLLTETRAMWPAASVCGWYFAHPESQYFSVLKNK